MPKNKLSLRVLNSGKHTTKNTKQRTLKKLKRRQRNGKTFHTHRTGGINMVKIPSLPKPIYRFSEIPIKIHFHRDRTKYPKMSSNHKRPHIAKAIFRKKGNKTKLSQSQVFKTCNKYVEIKRVPYWDKNRNTDQENRLNPKNKPIII